VSRYTRLPAQREVRLSGDLLGSVVLHLFQGESPDVGRNEYLCSATVEDLALRDGGRIILRLSFDEHCVMSVDAREARTGRALPVALDRSRPRGHPARARQVRGPGGRGDVEAARVAHRQGAREALQGVRRLIAACRWCLPGHRPTFGGSLARSDDRDAGAI
jgi:hypothetical protein